jgi:(4-(4-[2-(gamma-L-glutamylamino)ethyl]phenoxymethyl)furan-2-yl)methanamine synthase
MSRRIGLDIGGANLKISDGVRSYARPFPLWRSPERLTEQLRLLVEEFTCQEQTALDAQRSTLNALPSVAATMTGELADCFDSRRSGVAFILDSLERACRGRELSLWCTAGEFLTVGQAREFPMLVAAANWHALATWAGRMAPTASALLIDIGSTTTDIVPIENGLPMPAGRTDPERLRSGELVYLGMRRTPVCSLVSEVPLRGESVPVAREVFSTTWDAALLLEVETGNRGQEKEARNKTLPSANLPPQPSTLNPQPSTLNPQPSTDTADDRPATPEHAARRLARQLCCDRDELTTEELTAMARRIRSVQITRIADGMRQVLARMPASPSAILLTGEGERLAEEMLTARFPELETVERIRMSRILGNDHSTAACAYALSQLP